MNFGNYLRYIYVVLLAGCLSLMYRYRYNIFNFILLPFPLITYSQMKLLSFAINDELLLSLLKMREIVEKEFLNIDVIPIVLCIGHKPIIIEKITYKNEFIQYEVTSKSVLLYINHNYYIRVLNILNSIWNNKPFHHIILHANIMNLSNLFSIIDTLNTIKRTFAVECAMSIYFDVSHINNNDLLNLNSKVIFQTIDNNTKNTLNNNYNSLINTILNNLLISSKFNTYNLIYYLQKNMNEIIDYIYNVSNCDFNIKYVFIHDINICCTASYYYSINTIINDLCSYTKFTSNMSLNRKNKFMIGFITIISCICGYLIYKKINHSSQYVTSTMNISNIISKNTFKKRIMKNNLLQHSTNILNYHFNNMATSMMSKQYANNIILHEYLLQNLEYHLQNIISNIDINVEFIDNPINNKNFLYLKNTIEQYINIYNQLISLNNFNKNENIMKYLQLIQNKIINIHDTWLQSLNSFTLLKKTKQLHEILNDINNSHYTIEQYKEFLNHVNALRDLLDYTSNDWWINNKFTNNYDVLLLKIKQMKNIGNELYNVLISKKNTAINSIYNHLINKKSILLQNHTLLKIYEINDEKKVDLSDSLNELSCNINDILKSDLLLLSDGPKQNIELKNNEYFIWNINVVKKILYYNEQYFDFLEKLKQYNISITKSFTNILNKKIYNYTYFHLFNSGHKVFTEYDLNKMAQNIDDTYNDLKNICSFIQLNCNEKIEYVNDIIRNNLRIIYHKIRANTHNSIICNYKYLKEWNENQDLIETIFFKQKFEYIDLIENFILNFKSLEDNVIKLILNASYDLTTLEYKYFNYIHQSVNSYESGGRSDLYKAKEFLLSLLNNNIESKILHVSNIDTTYDIAFYTDIFKTSLQSRMNEIILQRSCFLYNKLVQFYNENLKNCTPFNLSGSFAKIEHIIQFINMYKNIRPHLIKDVNLLNKYASIKNDMIFLDKICELFIIENNNVYININFEDCNNDYFKISKNTNLILQYIANFGMVKYKDAISIQHKHNILDSFKFCIRIANSSEMEIAPYATDSHITTTSTYLNMNYNHVYGIFNFINKLVFDRVDNDVILRIPIKIVNINNIIDNMVEEDFIITYIKINNWHNIHEYELSFLIYDFE